MTRWRTGENKEAKPACAAAALWPATAALPAGRQKRQRRPNPPAGRVRARQQAIPASPVDQQLSGASKPTATSATTVRDRLQQSRGTRQRVRRPAVPVPRPRTRVKELQAFVAQGEEGHAAGPRSRWSPRHAAANGAQLHENGGGAEQVQPTRCCAARPNKGIVNLRHNAGRQRVQRQRRRSSRR